jgi:hypothetical protein
MSKELTFNEFQDTYMKDVEWGIISFNPENNVVVVCQSKENVFINNSAMYFWKNRDMFFDLVKIMDNLETKAQKEKKSE